jgi:integrase
MSTLRSKELPAKVRVRNGHYYYRCRLNGRQKEIPLGSDLAAARRLAKQEAGKMAASKSGLANPREQRWSESEQRSLIDHIHDWAAYLASKRSVPHHVNQSRDRVLRIIEAARVVRISGLTIGTVQPALADLRLKPGRKGRTRMSDSSMWAYTRAVKSFSPWLWRDGRVRDDALAHMAAPEVNDRMVRRALEAEEASALIAITPTRRRRACLSGPDRAVLYATALGTGFGLGEQMSLTAESFRLDEDPPVIVCLGPNTKNSKDAIQPVRPELADMLRDWLKDKPPGEPVFPINRDDAARSLRLDLADAGVDHSEEFDFHCLRHSFVSLLVKSGGSVKVCQALARHSDLKLTMNIYTHLTVHDVAKGLEGLSHILPTSEVLSGLTGTDGGATISSPGRPETVPGGLPAKMPLPNDWVPCRSSRFRSRRRWRAWNNLTCSSNRRGGSPR